MIFSDIVVVHHLLLLFLVLLLSFSVSMEAAASISSPSFFCNSTPSNNHTKKIKRQRSDKVDFTFSRRRKCNNLIASNQRLMTVSTAAVTDVSSVADPGQVEVTWQIIVGTIAGITPFIVAGIEFSKRIIAQRRCEKCGGSGLVFREKEYFKCPGCGGFLPWLSWKRFFTG